MPAAWAVEVIALGTATFPAAVVGIETPLVAALADMTGRALGRAQIAAHRVWDRAVVVVSAEVVEAASVEAAVEADAGDRIDAYE